MNLNIKRWCFGIVFLEIVACVLAGLRFEQLVKFSCDICSPEPDECCVGTVIHKDVILTTSYCATSCQSIHKYSRNISIVKTYKQPRLETKSRHDIALVIINLDWQLRQTAKLNSIAAFSGIGLKAYYPFMDDGNTRMREMIVEKCGKPEQRIYGNHVCGAKTNNIETKKCFQRQGVPLLLHGKIIALTAATNNKLCNHEQIVFNTIDPELSWIKSTIAELYPDDRLNEIDSGPAPDHNIRPSLETSLITSKQPNFPTPTTRSLPTLTTLKKVTQYSTPTRTLNPTERLKLISLLMSKRPSTETATKAALETSLTPTVLAWPPLISSVNLEDVFSKSLLMSTRPNENKREVESEASRSTTVLAQNLNLNSSGMAARLEDVTFPIFSTKTDVMEWFNQKVRNKLKSGNYSYFVLTTVKPDDTATSFVDLTV